MAEIRLRSGDFRREREAGWRALEDMVGRVERRGLNALSAAELRRLPLLYRAAVSSLSVARATALDWDMIAYLESLCLRAHLAVYATRHSVRRLAAEFVGRDLPRAVRAAWGPLLVAALLMTVGLVAGWAMVAGDPAWFDRLVPAALADGRGPDASAADLLAVIYPDDAQPLDDLVFFAAWLFDHNAMVAVLAFALGVAGGVPTILLMLYNGMVLGAFLAIHARHDLLVDFGGWLLIHGVTELLAVVLAGGAGLVLADAALFPDRLSRRAMLARRGPEAALMAVGAVLLLVAAAVLEGLGRQLVLDPGARWTLAGLTGLIWLAWFALAGRR